MSDELVGRARNVGYEKDSGELAEIQSRIATIPVVGEPHLYAPGEVEELTRAVATVAAGLAGSEGGEYRPQKFGPLPPADIRGSDEEDEKRMRLYDLAEES